MFALSLLNPWYLFADDDAPVNDNAQEEDALDEKEEEEDDDLDDLDELEEEEEEEEEPADEE
jgi:hypothetical protein